MRNTVKLDNDWFFTKEEQKAFPHERDGDWERISLPHTWNSEDGQDGGADYYKGDGYYFKSIYVHRDVGNRKYFLKINAAANECAVYWNKKEVARHIGGYSAFCVDVTKELLDGNNEITIKVCNVVKNSIYPQMADFTFYGGLYRGAELVITEETHFGEGALPADGIKLWSTVKEKGTDAVLHIESRISGAEKGDTVCYTLFDRDGNETIEAVRGADASNISLKLGEVRLWNGVKDPYLYTLRARIIRKNQVVDELNIKHGFRYYHVDAQKGFYLNGELTPLRGVSRHQDKLGKGNALSYEDHVRDAELMAEVGANTVRLAHYQHSEEFYSLCDEFGFIVWAEIPFISKMSDDPKAHENCISQLTELIEQNFNHSSIFFWGIANEITIGGGSDKLEENLRDLDRLVKKLDPTRLSTIAQVSPLPMDAAINGITDIIAYNHYFGWYGGELIDNEKWFDGFHERYPDRAIGISEYGCEGIISYHNDAPRAGDYSEEYQALYHEHMLRLLESRDWIWGSYLWNMFDFGCDARDEGGVKGRNNKGLVSFDRLIKKDAFYLYKAYWSKTPFLHICGKRQYVRGASACFKIYTNLDNVKLLLDGEEVGFSIGGRVHRFEGIKLHGGCNVITAVCGGIRDTAVIERSEEVPEGFVLKQSDEGMGVTNWFEDKKASNVGELTFKEGFYSVKNTVSQLLQSEDAAKVITDAMSSVSGMRLKSSMLMIMGDQSVESMLKGDMVSGKLGMDERAVLNAINKELQKIPISE